jgi:hypothetical protein
MLSVLFWVAVGVVVAWYVPGVGKVKGVVDAVVGKVKGLWG